MAYSILVLGATGLIGSKIAQELSLHKDTLKKVAFLTPTATADPEKEAKYAEVRLNVFVEGWMMRSLIKVQNLPGERTDKWWC